MHSLNFDVAVVDGIGQMGGGSSGFATGNVAVIQDRHGFASAAELVRTAEAGDPSADNTDIDANVFT